MTDEADSSVVLAELQVALFWEGVFGRPVAYLSPTSRCLTVGAVIVIPGCDRSGIKVILVFIFMVCLEQSSA